MLLPDEFWSDLGPIWGLVLAFLIFVVVPIVAAVASVWSVRRSGMARDAASRAARYAEPTGNGFARRVEDQLAQLTETVNRARIESRDDTEQLRREVSGLRGDLSEVRGEVGEVRAQATENRRGIRDLRGLLDLLPLPGRKQNDNEGDEG